MHSTVKQNKNGKFAVKQNEVGKVVGNTGSFDEGVFMMVIAIA